MLPPCEQRQQYYTYKTIATIMVLAAGASQMKSYFANYYTTQLFSSLAHNSTLIPANNLPSTCIQHTECTPAFRPASPTGNMGNISVDELARIKIALAACFASLGTPIIQLWMEIGMKKAFASTTLFMESVSSERLLSCLLACFLPFQLYIFTLAASWYTRQISYRQVQLHPHDVL